jgi:hypothetical protein
LSQLFDKFSLGIVIEFGPEFSRFDKTRVDVSLSSVLQYAGLLDITDYDCDFSGYVARGASVGNRHKIGAFART